MPIYEYACEACGHQLEAIQKFSDPELKDCPACGKPALKKLLSASGFHLKGSGWYATDFKGSGKKDGGVKQEGGDAKDSGKKETTGATTDTKKDTKGGCGGGCAS